MNRREFVKYLGVSGSSLATATSDKECLDFVVSRLIHISIQPSDLDEHFAKYGNYKDLVFNFNFGCYIDNHVITPENLIAKQKTGRLRFTFDLSLGNVIHYKYLEKLNNHVFEVTDFQMKSAFDTTTEITIKAIGVI